MNFLSTSKSVRQYIKIMNTISIIFGISSCTYSKEKSIYDKSWIPLSVSFSYFVALLIYFSFKVYIVNLNLESFTLISVIPTTSLIILCSIINAKTFAKVFNHLLVQEQKYYLTSIPITHSLSIKFLCICLGLFFASFAIDFISYIILPQVKLFSFCIYLFYLYNLFTIAQISICLLWTKRCLLSINQIFNKMINPNKDEIISSNTSKRLNNWVDKSQVDVKLKVSTNTQYFAAI